jgi:hypothetical protein
MISKRITALALGAALAAASPAFAVPPPHGPHGPHGGPGHWHGGGGYGHGGGHWVGGRWIPWAVGGAILGGAIAAPYYYGYPGYGYQPRCWVDQWGRQICQ